jgi:hypothetical protein
VQRPKRPQIKAGGKPGHFDESGMFRFAAAIRLARISSVCLEWDGLHFMGQLNRYVDPAD